MENFSNTSSTTPPNVKYEEVIDWEHESIVSVKKIPFLIDETCGTCNSTYQMTKKKIQDRDKDESNLRISNFVFTQKPKSL